METINIGFNQLPTETIALIATFGIEVALKLSCLNKRLSSIMIEHEEIWYSLMNRFYYPCEWEVGRDWRRRIINLHRFPPSKLSEAVSYDDGMVLSRKEPMFINVTKGAKIIIRRPHYHLPDADLALAININRVTHLRFLSYYDYRAPNKDRITYPAIVLHLINPNPEVVTALLQPTLDSIIDYGNFEDHPEVLLLELTEYIESGTPPRSFTNISRTGILRNYPTTIEGVQCYEVLFNKASEMKIDMKILGTAIGTYIIGRYKVTGKDRNAKYLKKLFGTGKWYDIEDKYLDEEEDEEEEDEDEEEDEEEEDDEEDDEDKESSHSDNSEKRKEVGISGQQFKRKRTMELNDIRKGIVRGVMEACVSIGDIESIKYLLESGVPMIQFDDNDYYDNPEISSTLATELPAKPPTVELLKFMVENGYNISEGNDIDAHGLFLEINLNTFIYWLWTNDIELIDKVFSILSNSVKDRETWIEAVSSVIISYPNLQLSTLEHLFEIGGVLPEIFPTTDMEITISELVVEGGNIEVIKYLVEEKDMDINPADILNNNNLPDNLSEELLSYLISLGLDVNDMDLLYNLFRMERPNTLQLFKILVNSGLEVTEKKISKLSKELSNEDRSGEEVLKYLQSVLKENSKKEIVKKKAIGEAPVKKTKLSIKKN